MKQLTAAVCLAALVGAVMPAQAQRAAPPTEQQSTQYQPCDVSDKKPGVAAKACAKSALCEASGRKCFVCPACGEKGATHGTCPKCGTEMRCMEKKTVYACPNGCVTSDKPGRCPKCRATLRKSERWVECPKPCADKKPDAAKPCMDKKQAPCDAAKDVKDRCPATKK